MCKGAVSVKHGGGIPGATEGVPGGGFIVETQRGKKRKNFLGVLCTGYGVSFCRLE